MATEARRWERIQELFHAALELPESERRAYVEARAEGDVALLASVLELLAADARGIAVLDRGVAQVARDVLDGALPAERTVGPYRLQRVLGEGGMGVVYLARRGDLGSLAAIKVLRDAWVSPARRERFATEQRMLARLSHDSIARLFDADTLPDGTPYFVMEYVEGEALTAYCAARASGIAERLALFRSVCDAVLYAHRHAIIHRDLKPSNILVRADGTVKLLDFGIAKQLEELDAPTQQTRTAQRLLTPAYAAPEQVRGDSIGTYTDIYALGVVLYELLTGRLPFDLATRSPAQADAVVLEQEPERPSVAARRGAATGARTAGVPGTETDAGSAPGLPAVDAGASAWADLDVLCLTAMHKDPQRRYRTVDALIRDLDHFLRGEPLDARPDTVRYRAGKFLRRNWKPVAGAAVATAVVLALIGFYTIRLSRARDLAVAEAARTARIQRFTLDLFAGGEQLVGPSDTLRVVTLVDRGVREARVLDAEPTMQAELLMTLGGIYQKLGRFERADSLLSAALAQRRGLLGDQHEDVAESLVALGLLRSDQARLEDAEAFARDGLAVARALLPAQHPSVVRALTAVGRIRQERGDYAGAIAMLSEAVRMQGGQPVASPEYTESLNALANTYYYAGDLVRSDSLNRIVLALDRQVYGEQHPRIADDLINVGAIEFDRGRHAEAERLYRQALDVFMTYHGSEHPQTASILTILARAIIPQGGREAEAQELLERSLATKLRLFGEVHSSVASTLNELGSVALMKGEYDAAETYFTRMASIYRQVRGEDHYLVAIALSNLASVYQARDRFDRAEPIYRDVIDRYTRALSAEHLNTGVARVKLGRVLTRTARHTEAEGHLLAGYDILMKQTSPTARWLQQARTDLVEVYEALGQPEKAERFRKELAGAGAGAAARPGS